MQSKNIIETIRDGETSLGIELGSTRIKAVLIDDAHTVLAQGSFAWENRLENGVWTYSLDDAVSGLQACYTSLIADIREKYGITPETYGCIGISGMMHGFLALDEAGKPLTPFRTWRNIMTAEASELLTNLFSCNIPQRWSAAHLCQVVLDGEPYAKNIARLTTLSGYIHTLLTGKNVLGCNEASGMFPLDPSTLFYDGTMVQAFDAFLASHDMPYSMRDIFPKPLAAGEDAGALTEAGAALLDPTGRLRPGIPFCPPEGDGGTGMVCTGSVSAGRAAVSVGTSAFALFVLDRPIRTTEREIETELTPGGAPAAQIHGNNGTSELDLWVGFLADGLRALGRDTDPGALYEPLLKLAMEADPACGGVTAYNNLAGEHLTHLPSGAPLYFRDPAAHADLGCFMRAQLSAVFAPLACGYALLQKEHVRPDIVLAHGGLFRTEGAAQTLLSAAFGVPVSVRATAGEGGPYGTALLAAYRKNRAAGETLAQYLDEKVFAGQPVTTVMADEAAITGFRTFLARSNAGLDAARAAAAAVKGS